MDKDLRNVVIGVGLMCGIAGAVVYYQGNEQGREQQQIKRNFAAATAEDQLESVRHGRVKIICPDKATQTTYEDRSIQTAAELLKKYREGCTPFYSGNGYKFSLK